MAGRKRPNPGERLPGIEYADPIETRVLRMKKSLWDFLEAKRQAGRGTVQAQLRRLVEAEVSRANSANLNRERP